MPYTYEYPRPALTVDAVIISGKGKNAEVLLISRDKPPYEGQWALPGGFVEMEETVEEAVKRELQEETGLQGIILRQLHAFSKLGRDPRGRTVSVTFYGFTDSKTACVKASDDARDAAWFRIDNLPDLAFDHREIMDYALQNIAALKK